jgi:CBS domain-containing protein
MMLNQTALEAKRYGVFICEHCMRLSDAVKQMVSEDISALVITDEDGYLAGILSRTDLIRAAIERGDDWWEQPVGAFMNKDVITVPPAATLRDVGVILLDNRIHRVVVAYEEGGRKRPLSVISATDIVYHLAKDI